MAGHAEKGRLRSKSLQMELGFCTQCGDLVWNGSFLQLIHLISNEVEGWTTSLLRGEWREQTSKHGRDGRFFFEWDGVKFKLSESLLLLRWKWILGS